MGLTKKRSSMDEGSRVRTESVSFQVRFSTHSTVPPGVTGQGVSLLWKETESSFCYG